MKDVPGVDLLAVAAGFVLRAVAGGLAAGLRLSPLFLVVAGFGALLLVTGKRMAEAAKLGAGAASHRAVLAWYTPARCRGVLAGATCGALAAYGAWAVSGHPHPGGRELGPWLALSIVPFAAGVLRADTLMWRAEGGVPQEMLFRDKALLASGALCGLLLVVGIYVA